LRKPFRYRDQRELNGKKKRYNKNNDENNIGACLIEIAQQELNNTRADQSARSERFSINGDASFDQSAKKAGARQRKEGKSEDALGGHDKSRTQKVLKRAG